eukprot:g11168.t1
MDPKEAESSEEPQAFAQDKAARNSEKKMSKRPSSLWITMSSTPNERALERAPAPAAVPAADSPPSDPSSSPPSASATPGVGAGAAGTAVPKVARLALPKAKAKACVSADGTGAGGAEARASLFSLWPTKPPSEGEQRVRKSVANLAHNWLSRIRGKRHAAGVMPTPEFLE